MEALPKGNLLKFKPDHLQTVRKMFDLDKPGRMKEAVDLLSNWVAKQDHFKKKDFSRDYLEILLITCKGSVERAKTRLDRLCTFRTIWPELFTTIDINSFKRFFKIFNSIVLPEPTDDLARVNIFKVYPNQPLSSDLFTEYIKYSTVICEYVKAQDYPSGFLIILDYTDVNIVELLSILSPTRLSQMVSLYMEGYGMRIKGIHILTTSKMSDALLSLLKQVLSKKVGSRLHVHKDFEGLHGFLPKKILPADYGGEAATLNELRDEMLMELSTKKHMAYMEEINSASLDEAKRPKDLYNESIIGMPGSFRALCVD